MADDESVKVTATLPKTIYDKLVDLAEKRGLSANTVLMQAIQNEDYFSKKQEDGATVLIEEPDRSFRKVTLSSSVL